MDPVSMLIFNALVRRQSINLPDIGSLKVISRPPVMEKKGVLTPPSNQVIYTETEFPEFTSIITLIAQSSNKDEAQSWDIYGRWLASVRGEGYVRIGSVGEIRDNRFFAAPELSDILNPVSSAPVQLPRQMEIRQILIWVIGAVIIGGAISVGVIKVLNRNTYEFDASYAPDVPATPLAAVADSTTTDSLSAGPDAPFDTPAATAETPAAAKPAASRTPAAETKPAASPKTAPAAPSAAPNIASGQMGYYVVVGTYSTDQNANKFIANARKEAASLSFHKLVLGNGKIMIYTGAATSEQEANTLKRQCAGSFPDAWIYKRRAK